jgi:hypothetical protein
VCLFDLASKSTEACASHVNRASNHATSSLFANGARSVRRCVFRAGAEHALGYRRAIHVDFSRSELHVVQVVVRPTAHSLYNKPERNARQVQTSPRGRKQSAHRRRTWANVCRHQRKQVNSSPASVMSQTVRGVRRSLAASSRLFEPCRSPSVTPHTLHSWACEVHPRSCSS